MMSTIESIKSLILDLPPSCVEFWPLNPQYVIVGTYNLEKPDADQEASITIASSAESESDTDADESKFNKGQQRNGSLILLEVRSDDV
jgi:diphthamide biosynthesis protein 7